MDAAPGPVWLSDGHSLSEEQRCEIKKKLDKTQEKLNYVHCHVLSMTLVSAHS